MASYVKYETPKEIVAKSLEALTIANDTGKVRKGANEATKGIESGTAQLVLIASDVEPQEVVMHLPEICKEKSIAYVYIPTKKEIGAACGIPVPCAAVSIDKAGNATEMVKAIAAKVAPMCGIEEKKAEPKAEEKKEQKAEAKHEKKEHKEKKKKEAPKEKAEEKEQTA